MTNKEKFNIIYKHFAKPIADMKRIVCDEIDKQDTGNIFI